MVLENFNGYDPFTELLDINAILLGDIYLEIKRYIGKESFFQAEKIAKIAEWCYNNEPSVICFTGFLCDKLKSINKSSIDRLLLNLDILVDAPFIQEEFDTGRD